MTNLQRLFGTPQNLYQWKALLTLLANRILKLVKKHDFKWSLVDLFPEQYESLPEHFVAIACAMVCDIFNLNFESHTVFDL
jgi:hypothetical protein